MLAVQFTLTGENSVNICNTSKGREKSWVVMVAENVAWYNFL
jgi:hypothetical protein